ncbi:hypothetical protein AGMMS49921_12750 [Endomicrobiia bacterium]|nr:hypothetical protein AGMMS49921_12750 [Endomicrobiia bacterium]
MFVEYDFYKSESIRQKIYGELVLRSGQITNGFTGTINNEESKYKDLENMYEGFELGIGRNHKINKK